MRFYLFVALVTMVGMFSMQVIGGFYLQDQLGLSSDQLAVTVSFGFMLNAEDSTS